MLLTSTLPRRLLNLSSSSSPWPALRLLLFFFFSLPHSWAGSSGLFSQSWPLFWGKRMHVTRSSHLEKHDWLETFTWKQMPSGSQKTSDGQLWQVDYNRLQPHIHIIVKLSYIFWDYWSYIVHRAKLSYKYDNYCTPGNSDRSGQLKQKAAADISMLTNMLFTSQPVRSYQVFSFISRLYFKTLTLSL